MTNPRPPKTLEEINNPPGLYEYLLKNRNATQVLTVEAVNAPNYCLKFLLRGTNGKHQKFLLICDGSGSDRVNAIQAIENPQFLEDLKLDRSLEEVVQGWEQPSDMAVEEIPDIIGCAIAKALRQAVGTNRLVQLAELLLRVAREEESDAFEELLTVSRELLREGEASDYE